MSNIQSHARIISLDRGYPLAAFEDAELHARYGELRTQHAIELVKNAAMRAAVGDVVDLDFPSGQDTPLITRIHDRSSQLVRRALVESRHEGAGKHDEQVLAANFELVVVVSALGTRPLDQDYLERQLVMAHQSGAAVVLCLTKADLARDAQADLARAQASAPGCGVVLTSAHSGEGLGEAGELRRLLAHKVSVLLGRSGVGKSTLINELCGATVQATSEVREKDRAGRHTTVARRMVFLPEGGAVIDAPGLRSIGLYDAHVGLALAFPEITALGAQCRYRDCTHTHEPGCAVIAAEQAGTLSERRLASYRIIRREVED